MSLCWRSMSISLFENSANEISNWKIILLGWYYHTWPYSHQKKKKSSQPIKDEQIRLTQQERKCPNTLNMKMRTNSFPYRKQNRMYKRIKEWIDGQIHRNLHLLITSPVYKRCHRLHFCLIQGIYTLHNLICASHHRHL